MTTTHIFTHIRIQKTLSDYVKRIIKMLYFFKSFISFPRNIYASVVTNDEFLWHIYTRILFTFCFFHFFKHPFSVVETFELTIISRHFHTRHSSRQQPKFQVFFFCHTKNRIFLNFVYGEGKRRKFWNFLTSEE